jgi:hypothetical protein
MYAYYTKVGKEQVFYRHRNFCCCGYVFGAGFKQHVHTAEKGKWEKYTLI